MGKNYKPTGNPVGRPCKFKSPEELQECFKKYLESKPQVISLSGFCVFIDSYRDYLWQLQENKPEFINTIKRITEYCAENTLNRAVTQGKTQALDIFLLKNYGYTDKTEQDINVKGNISIEKLFSEIEETDKKDK